MSVLPDDEFIWYYSLFQEVSLLLSTIVVGCTLFVVARASPKNMGVYQWFIFNEVLGSYTFDVAYLIFQPVPLLPYSCAYSAGPFRHSNYSMTKFLVCAVICLSYYKFISLTAALFYRYLKSLPPSGNGLMKLLDYPRWFNVTLIVLGCLLLDLIMLTTFSKAEIPQDLVKQDISQTSPAHFNVIQHEPSLICYWLHGEKYGGSALYFLVAVAVVFGIFTITIFVLAYLTVRNFLRTDSSYTHISFQRVHRILLISWGLQLASLVLFIGVPFFIWFLMLLFHPPNENYWVLVSLCLCGLHTMVECAILLIVITPYRKYVLYYAGRRNEQTEVSIRVVCARGKARHMTDWDQRSVQSVP